MTNEETKNKNRDAQKKRIRCNDHDLSVAVTALLESPQVLIAEEEKIIVEETKGDQTIVEEKYVYIKSLLFSVDRTLFITVCTRQMIQ